MRSLSPSPKGSASSRRNSPKKTRNRSDRPRGFRALVLLFFLFFGGTALSGQDVVYKIQKPGKQPGQDGSGAAAGTAEVRPAKAAREAVKPAAGAAGRKAQKETAEPAVQGDAPAAAVAEKPEGAKAPPEAARAPLSLYDPAGKTDPFKSFIAEEEAVEQKQKKEPKTYLETLELSQLNLIAIVETAEGNWAMVRDSKGIGYPIRKGTAIGTREGVVLDIKSNQVVIREQHRDIRGKVEVKYVKMELTAPQ